MWRCYVGKDKALILECDCDDEELPILVTTSVNICPFCGYTLPEKQ